MLFILFFDQFKGYHLTCYNYITSTYNKSITSETSNMVQTCAVHYESLNLVSYKHTHISSNKISLHLNVCLNYRIEFWGL